jgi:hypothetical protein
VFCTIASILLKPAEHPNAIITIIIIILRDAPQLTKHDNYSDNQSQNSDLSEVTKRCNKELARFQKSCS